MSSLRRPRHRTYDYNFKVGASSYQDMLDYLDKKDAHRNASPPPTKKTFAERFAEKPFYGDPGPLKLSSAQLPERRPSPRRPLSPEASPLPARRRDQPERRPLRFSDDDDADDDGFLKVRPRAELETDLTDPDELIASIRRKNKERMKLLSSMEDDDEESAAAGGAGRRQRLVGADEELALVTSAAGDKAASVREKTSSARAALNSSYSASSSVSSKITSKTTTRSSAKEE